MADEFDLAALAKNWQQQPVDDEAMPDTNDLAKANQRQRRQKGLMYAEWLGALIMLATAIWLVLNLQGWLGYISAAFLLLGAASTAYISWHIHRPILAYDNWSSNGLLHFRLNSCCLSLRYYRLTQLSCATLIVFSLILWLLDWWQLASVTSQLLLIYSLVVSPLCLFGIILLQQSARHKKDEIAHLTALASDFNQI
ncbi:MAG: hypothetical protein R3241_09800 [Rheinheimera sp.]|nr:hypothetical protein [Rheinheimera sp.]